MVKFIKNVWALLDLITLDQIYHPHDTQIMIPYNLKNILQLSYNFNVYHISQK